MAIDAERLQRFMARYASDQAAAMHAATVVLGDQLGLFRALADAGPTTAAELAELTGYHPRLVAEWLRAQAVSDYCAYDASRGQFWLTPEQEACLADADGPAFLAGGLATASALHRGIDAVADAFRQHTLLAWGDHDPSLFTGVARAFRAPYENHLASSWIPALEGIEQRLRTGGRVADVACGYGTSTIVLGRAYPAAEVVGYDSHDVSIGAAREAAAEAGVGDHVRFEVADAVDLPAGDDHDLVCIFNALHEMGDPVAVCRGIREVLADDGSLMLVEPLAGDGIDDGHTPVGRSFSAASTMVCLPSALSQGGVWPLGAQAPDAEFAAVAAEAGFDSCRRVAETLVHRVLELR